MAAKPGQYWRCEVNTGEWSQGSAEVIGRRHGERREGPRHQGAELCPSPTGKDTGLPREDSEEVVVSPCQMGLRIGFGFPQSSGIKADAPTESNWNLSAGT